MAGNAKPAVAGSSPGINPNAVAVPQPQAAPGALAFTTQALKQNVDSLMGARGKPTDRAVTFNDLITLGLLSSSAAASASGTTGLGVGTVERVSTSGAGISGGPITVTGTLSVEWNAGEVDHLGSHLTLSGGTLDALPAGVTSIDAGLGLYVTDSVDPITSTGTINAEWFAGNVRTLDHASLTLEGQILAGNWQLPHVAALQGLAVIGKTLTVTAGMAPLVTGDTPGPALMADGSGQCIMVPL